MASECAECAAKIDCDSIICSDCLLEIINKVNTKNQGLGKQKKFPIKVGVRHG
ncbi:MAG: hypothetical protein ACYDHZ_01785 [Dehalococcoidia bacterium]